MGQPLGPFNNRGPIEYTSIASPVTFSPPIAWVQVVSAGSGGLVVKDQGGVSRTITGLAAGDPPMYGPFTEITSMTCAKIRVGDGQAPAPSPVGLAAAVTTTLTTSQGMIEFKPTDFALATGAPLAIFANGASSVPGLYSDGTKVQGVRWNNAATLNAIMASRAYPSDMDQTVVPSLVVYAAKVGATLADASTFDVGLYNQVVGALYDADSNFGSTTGAMTGDAASKTEQSVTLATPISVADLAAPPASLTVSIKPTDGTLGTDDLVLIRVRIFYTKKLLAA